MAFPDPPSCNSRNLPVVSVMAIEYLNYHLKTYEARQGQLDDLRKEPRSAFTIKSGVPRLQEAAAAAIVKSLCAGPVDPATIKVLTDETPPHLIRMVVDDPRIHYSSFRRLNAVRPKDEDDEEVDVWIQRNEKWMRVDGTDWGLVSLEDAEAIFPTALHSPTSITIPRIPPPPTSFTFLDYYRSPSLSILPTNDAFITTFNRVTSNCLSGVNWDNLLIAGGLPLNILLCTTPTHEATFKSSDIDLYIHGLSPRAANKKIAHIYDVWRRNIGDDAAAASICVRNSKTVNFLGVFPGRRIQIVLKIVKNAAEVLLNFDLDPCAIGFDGKKVVMLPRAARALETGWTVFTMGLVHGHHLGDRRATQETRVYKYASRGFGLRILPAYMKDMTLNPATRVPHSSAWDRASGGRGYRRRWDGGDGGGDGKVLVGLTAVKRVAMAAEDMVRRFVLDEVVDAGPKTPDDSSVYSFDERTWAKNSAGEDVPVCSFRVLDALKQHIGQPNGRLGIGSFEHFSRHCAAWKLECCGLLKIDYNDFADTYQTEGAYDDLPSFTWDEKFSAQKFMKDIDMYNVRLYRNMLGLYDHLEERNNNSIAYTNKHKPARIVHGPTFEAAMACPLLIPVVLPRDLAESFEAAFNSAMEAAGLSDVLFHRDTNTDGANKTVPQWIVGVESMWARIDRTIDEIFEILWTFFHIQQLTPGHISAIGLADYNQDDGDDDEDNYADYEDAEPMQYLLREHLHRRIPRVPERDEVQGWLDWPGKREKKRFVAWMKEYPREVYRGSNAPFCSTSRFKEGREWRFLMADDEDEGKGKRKRVDSRVLEGEKWPKVGVEGAE